MKPTILIVDDDKTTCKGLERLLSDDYVTYKAFNGMEAIDTYNQHGEEIDIILCDIVMPIMEGTEMIERIRAENKNVVIIVMTALYSSDKVHDAIAKGANDYLIKPLDIPELETILRNSLAN